jgi:putative transposase
MAQSNNTIEFKLNEQDLKDYISSEIKTAVVAVMETVLNSEAEEMVRARPYERTNDRQDRRNGTRKRKLVTKVGEVELTIPRLRTIPFQSQIIARYQRMESSLEEALLEMYLQGVSTRRVTDITEALNDTTVSPMKLSRLNNKLGDKLTEWRERPLASCYVYMYLDGTVIRARVGGKVETVAILVAMGVNQDGYREILAVAMGYREDKDSWVRLLRQLRRRGLKQVGLIVADAHAGLNEAIREVFPMSDYQRCIFHLMRNVLSQAPRRLQRDVCSSLRAVFAQENEIEARRKAKRFADQFSKILPQAVNCLEGGLDDALKYYRYPQEHWHCIRTNNPLERLMREIKRRLKVVGVFPSTESALLLATARLKWIHESKWAERIYLTMNIEEIIAA